MRTVTEIKAYVLKITKSKMISKPITRTSIPFFINTCFYEGTKRYKIGASRSSNKAKIKYQWQNQYFAYVILIVYHSIINKT